MCQIRISRSTNRIASTDGLKQLGFSWYNLLPNEDLDMPGMMKKMPMKSVPKSKGKPVPAGKKMPAGGKAKPMKKRDRNGDMNGY